MADFPQSVEFGFRHIEHGLIALSGPPFDGSPGRAGSFRQGTQIFRINLAVPDLIGMKHSDRYIVEKGRHVEIGESILKIVSDRQLSAEPFFQILFCQPDETIEIFPVDKGPELIPQRRRFGSRGRRHDRLEGSIICFPFPVKSIDGAVFLFQMCLKCGGRAFPIAGRHSGGQCDFGLPAQIKHHIAEKIRPAAHGFPVEKETGGNIILHLAVPEIQREERVFRPAPVNRRDLIAGCAIRSAEENVFILPVLFQPPEGNRHLDISGSMTHKSQAIGRQMMLSDQRIRVFYIPVKPVHIEVFAVFRGSASGPSHGYGTRLDPEGAHFIQDEFPLFEIRFRFIVQLGYRTDEDFRFSVAGPAAACRIILKRPLVVDRFGRNELVRMIRRIQFLAESGKSPFEISQSGFCSGLQPVFIGAMQISIRESQQRLFLFLFEFPEFSAEIRCGGIPVECGAFKQFDSFILECRKHHGLIVTAGPFLERCLAQTVPVIRDDRSHIEMTVVFLGKIPQGLRFQMDRIASLPEIQFQQSPAIQKNAFPVHRLVTHRTEFQNVVQQERILIRTETDGNRFSRRSFQRDPAAKRNIIALLDRDLCAVPALIFRIQIQHGDIVDPFVGPVIFQTESIPFSPFDFKIIIHQTAPVFDLIEQRGFSVRPVGMEKSVPVDQECRTTVSGSVCKFCGETLTVFQAEPVEFHDPAVRIRQGKPDIRRFQTGIIHRDLFPVFCFGIIPGREFYDLRVSSGGILRFGKIMQDHRFDRIFRFLNGPPGSFRQLIYFHILEFSLKVSEQTE